MAYPLDEEDLQVLLSFLSRAETLPPALAVVLSKLQSFHSRQEFGEVDPGVLTDLGLLTPAATRAGTPLSQGLASDFPATAFERLATESLYIRLPSLAQRLKRRKSQSAPEGETSNRPNKMRKRLEGGSGDPTDREGGSGDPADRERCKRGGKAVKSRLKLVRPRQSQYASDQEDPEDEPSENGFQPAHILPDMLPEVPSLPPRASHLILALALASRRIQDDEKSDTTLAVIKLFASLHSRGDETGMLRQRSDMRSHDMEELQDLAEKCVLAEAASTFLDFIYMVNCIQLRSKVISICLRTKKRPTTILKEIQKVRSARTLGRYVQDGGKYCLLAGAGSIFLLMIMAVAKLKSRVRDAELTSEVVQRISQLMRNPRPGHPLGQSVIEDIIPAISILRQRFRMTYPLMFSQELLFSCGLPPVIEISDLPRSDEFFDQLTFNAFVTPRNWTTWRPCLSTLGPSSVASYSSLSFSALSVGLKLPLLSTISTSVLTRLTVSLSQTAADDSDVCTVHTNYDPDLHKTPSFSAYEDDDSKMFTLTEEERVKAERAVAAASLLDFKYQVQEQLRDGMRGPDSSYISLTSDLLHEKRLMVRDKTGAMLFFWIPDLPEHLRRPLLYHLELVYQDSLKPTDSRQEEGFGALHFTFYNRYSSHGHQCPSDQDPTTFHKNPSKRKKNSSQFIPRSSKDIQQHPEEYLLLSECLESVFIWLREVLEKTLPEEYEVVKLFADVLPAGASSPAFPFSGFVVNLNVTTRIHRDDKDLYFCVVLVISSEDCEGGDTCFSEVGIRLGMRNGDILVFPSTVLSHFNLHFKGQRASVVMHTDGAGLGWVKERNGWSGSEFMNVSSIGTGDL